MKKKFIYLLILSLFPVLFFSCLKDDKDTWDGDKYQKRMAEYLAKCEKILTEEANGWHMQYYAGDAETNYTGIMSYHLSFKDRENVTVMADFDTEKLPAGTPASSLYSLKDDAGPTLSFDTYNELMHYWTEYKGYSFTYRGDFEFVFEELSPEKIVLRGKRYGRKIVLQPWDKEEPSVYLATVNDFINETAFPHYSVFSGASETYTASFDINTRKMSLRLAAETRHYFPLFDENGFMLKTMDNKEDVGYFTWNAATEEYIGTYEGETLRFVRNLPEGYIPFSDYLGRFLVSYQTSISANAATYTKYVWVTEEIKNKRLRISDDLTGYEFTLDYLWANNGKVSFQSQFLAEEKMTDGEIGYLYIMVLDSNKDTINVTKGLGLISENISDAPLSFRMVDNGNWPGFTVDAIFLRYMDATGTMYGSFFNGTSVYRNLMFTK